VTEPRCSLATAEAGEPLAGNAPLARTWVVLEQQGPYGARALESSHLPTAVGDAFRTATAGLPVTVVLARSAGHRHADDHVHASHRFWIAHVSPGGARMRTGVVEDLAELLTADLPDAMARAARGELPAWGTRSTEPLLLVCSNGRRDLCCAAYGRPIANELATDPPYASHLMEVSHLGGHRFAPTALMLPSGMSYGRLTTDTARAAIDRMRKSELSLDGARGLTALAVPLQVADLALREAYGLSTAGELEVMRLAPTGKLVPAPLHWDGDDRDEVEVVARHNDGRAWRVLLHRVRSAHLRPSSCGKAPVPASWWTADAPDELAPWR
jgi:hypothetical protein